jgi:uncharacterized protein with HEPN domain
MSTDRRLRVPDYLEHILEAIDRIERYIDGLDEAGFGANTLVQDASIRNLEIIGEACRRIQRDYPSFAERHPDLPLIPAYGMRNWLIHGYFNVRLKTVWETITDDLPEMRRQVEALRRGLKDEPGG